MYLLNEIKNMDKTNVYNSYVTIMGEKSKDYENISRQKMGKEIIDEFKKHPELLMDLLMSEEFNLVTTFLNETKVDGVAEISLCFHLSELFLLLPSYDDENIYFSVPEELVDVLTTLKEKIDSKKYKKLDKEKKLLLGLIKIYGITLCSNFDQICTLYKLKSDSNFPYLRRYTHFYQKGGMLYLCYDVLYDFEDEIIEKMFTYQMFLKIRDEDEVVRIAENGYDLNNKHINDYFSYLENNDMFSLEFRFFEAKEFFYSVHLQDFKSYQEVMKEFFEEENITYDKKLITLAKKAFNEIPSAVIMGNTKKEYEKRVKEEEKQLELRKPIKQYAKLYYEDVKLFYKIYFGILDYVNQRLQVYPGLKIYRQEGLIPKMINDVRNALFKNTYLFDDFIRENPFHFNHRDLKIVEQFKLGKKESFIILKYEKEFTVFVDQKEEYYGVIGLNCNINEIVDSNQLPYFVETALLPFNNKIVFDGVLQGSAVHFSNQSTENLLKKYRKENVRLVFNEFNS